MSNTEWMDQAACAGTPTDVFFPEPGDQSSTLAAKLICDKCPVRETCETHFLHEQDGIFGGRTPTERHEIRNGRNRPYKPPIQGSCEECGRTFHTLQESKRWCDDETCKRDRRRRYHNEYDRRRDLARLQARLAADRDAPMRGIA